MVLYRLGWGDLRGESHRPVLNTTTTFDTIPLGPTFMFVSDPTRLARPTPSRMDIPPSTTTAISLSTTTLRRHQPMPRRPTSTLRFRRTISSCLSFSVSSLLLQTRGLLPLGILIMLLDINRLPRVADPLIAHGARSQVPSVVEHVMGKRPLLRLVLVLFSYPVSKPSQQRGERKENSHAAQKSKTAPPPRQISPAPPPRPSPAP